MRIDIITLFPEVFTPLDTSIVKRAIDKGITEILIWNLRNFTKTSIRRWMTPLMAAARV